MAPLRSVVPEPFWTFWLRNRAGPVTVSTPVPPSVPFEWENCDTELAPLKTSAPPDKYTWAANDAAPETVIDPAESEKRLFPVTVRLLIVSAAPDE